MLRSLTRVLAPLAIASAALVGSAPAAPLTHAAPPAQSPVVAAPAMVLPAASASAISANAVAPAAASATSGNPQCQPTALLSAISTGGVNYAWTLPNPSVGGNPTTMVGTSGWPGARLWVIVDNAGLGMAVLNDGTVATYGWNPTRKRYENLAVLGHGWGNVRALLPQARGVVYAVLNDGTMYYYQLSADGKRFPVQSRVANTAGWSKYRFITGGADGTIYATDGAGNLLQWRKNEPYEVSGGWSYFGVVTPSLGPITGLAGAGDGLLFAGRSDGSLVRMVQWDPRRGTRTTAPAAVPGAKGFGAIRNLTANPNSCGDTPAQVKAQIAARAVSWAGTGRAFCTSHYCTPHWWCTDFAWGVWRDAGIGNVSLFRTYPASQEPATSDAWLRYGVPQGTFKGLNLQRIEPGDIMVWPAQTKNGTRYVGHNAIVTAVHRNSSGVVVSIDVIHGNWSNSVLYQRGVTPATANSITAVGWVSPRL